MAPTQSCPKRIESASSVVSLFPTKEDEIYQVDSRYRDRILQELVEPNYVFSLLVLPGKRRV